MISGTGDSFDLQSHMVVDFLYTTIVTKRFTHYVVKPHHMTFNWHICVTNKVCYNSLITV